MVTIRHPIDSISSTCYHNGKFGDQNISIEIEKYLDFYSWISNHIEEIVLVKFEDIISNFNLVIKELNERFGTKFNLFFDENKAKLRVMEEIRNTSPNKDDPYKIPIPNRLRKKMNGYVRSKVENHPKIKKALDLYYVLTIR